MDEEAEISVNGHALTDFESMMVRKAVESFANVMKELGFEDDGIALTDSYMIALTKIRSYF